MLRALLLSLALSLGVAGAGYARSSDACSILTPAAIKGALGVAPAGAGKSADFGVRHTCDWRLPRGSGLRLAVFDTAAANTLDPGAKPPWQPVAGLGGQAGYRRYNFTPRIAVAEVQAVLANQSFFVQVTGAPPNLPARKALVSLARTAAQGLR